MGIIKSKKYLKQIERRNQKKKDYVFTNKGFESISELEDSGKLRVDRLTNYNPSLCSNLNDGKNKFLSDYKQELNINFDSIQEWYKRIDVQFEIIKFLRNREFALLVPSWIQDKNITKRSTRTLRCHSIQHFQYLFNKGLRIFEKQTPYNLYYSLAVYEHGIPYQTLDFSKRDNTEWIKEHYKNIAGYDFLIDIDAGEHEDIYFAHETTLNIVELFNFLNIPFEVRFSGMGFHIVIPFCWLPKCSFNPSDENSIYKSLSSISKGLSKKYSEMIDLNIYDSRRIIKVPYSIALYEKDLYICTPFLSMKGLNDFRLENYQINNFNQIIKGRGIKLFNPEGNFNNLMEMFNMKNG